MTFKLLKSRGYRYITQSILVAIALLMPLFLVSKINRIHGGEGDIHWIDVLREVSHVAHAMAKHGLSLGYDITIF